MILREILESLQRIEETLGRRGTEGGQPEMERPVSGAEPAGAGKSADEWIQKGLDSIMSYQVGKKEENA